MAAVAPSTSTLPVATMAPAPATTSLSAPPPTLPAASNILERVMYKCLLNEHIQKEALPMAVYQSFNEGSVHSPRFRSTVLVGQEKFTSSNVFLHKKEAEQDAAKTAFECLSKRAKEEADPINIIHEGSVLCKSILNEYAVKRQLDMPVYNTTQTENLLPVFISTVFFNGVTYNGENAGTKKEAEQLAARAVILCLTNDADSTSSTILFKIIKSKSKLYALLPKNKDSQNGESSIVPVGNDNVPITAVSEAAPEGHLPEQAVAVIPTREAVGGGVRAPIAVEQSPNIPHHAFAIPKVEAIKEGIQLPIAFVPPTVDQSLDAGPSNGKRKRKNKRKSKKKMHTES